MGDDEMNQLEFQYLLRSQKSNYEQLLKMTDDACPYSCRLLRIKELLRTSFWGV